MAQRLRLIGTCRYVLGLLTPWRPAYRVSANPSRHRFFVTARDVVGRHISKYGAHERSLTAWIQTHLAGFDDAAGIVIDVGANLGWHTVHAAKLPSVRRVVAYEPDAFNAWLMDRNIAENEITNAVVNAVAVGSASGTAQLHSYKASNNGRHSLAFAHGMRSRTVPLVTLDGSLKQLGLADASILLMKIDVEGFEPAVLAGAPAALARTAAVITEYDPSSRLDGELAPQRLVDQLSQAKFTPHMLDDRGKPVAVDIGILAEGGQIDLIWLRMG